MEKKNKEILSLLLLFGLSVVYLYFLKLARGPINADETMGIIMAKDVFAKGNFLMEGWNFSTGITTLQLLWAMLFCDIFGYSYTTLYVVAALNYAILVGILTYIAAANSEQNTKNRFIVSVFVVFLTINPKSASVMNTCTATLLYAVCILVVYTAYKMYIRSSRLVVYIIMAVLMGCLAAFNDFMMYYMCASIGVLGIVYLLLGLGNKRQSWYLVICGIISVATDKLVSKIWVVLREKEPSVILSECFVSKENLIGNIVQVISNILYEFGIDIWGKKLISIDTLRAIVGFIALVCVIKILMQYAKLDENKKMLVVAILNIGIINLLAFGVSTIPSYSQSTHLMELFGWCLICASAVCLGNIKLKEATGINKGVLLIIIISFFAFNIPGLAAKPVESYTSAVTEYLWANGYTKGFATYWATGNIMFESNMQMEVAPITKFYDDEYPQGVIGGWRFATKDEWLYQEGQFIVVENESPFGVPYGITAQEIVDVYGMPSNQVDMGNCIILLYDQGILLKR